MLKNVVEKNRSYRRFYGDYMIERSTLESLVELARLSPSGKNIQPLKYILSCNTETNAKIFSTLLWAGYLKDWDGPVPSERPSGYIVMLTDKKLATGTPAIDQGIACQSMLLGAVEAGLGGCIVASVMRTELVQLLNIPDTYEVALVIALGKPKEDVRIVSLPESGDIKYYRDANGVHYVPKRALKDIIL